MKAGKRARERQARENAPRTRRIFKMQLKTSILETKKNILIAYTSMSFDLSRLNSRLLVDRVWQGAFHHFFFPNLLGQGMLPLPGQMVHRRRRRPFHHASTSWMPSLAIAITPNDKRLWRLPQLTLAVFKAIDPDTKTKLVVKTSARREPFILEEIR